MEQANETETAEAVAAAPSADASIESSPASSAPASSIKINDGDRDSLHILPLAILPFETAALSRARLIKNVRLKPFILAHIKPQNLSKPLFL